MVKQRTYSQKKIDYCDRLVKLVRSHDKAFVVGCDHVGSLQMQRIRMALRGEATIIMGKNTLIRRTIRKSVKNETDPLLKLVYQVKGNVGFIFVKGDLNKVKEIIDENRVPAYARAGVIAPNDVVVPAQQTQLDPSQTSFFQALNISTKITKGHIEILNDINLITEGEKVGNSAAALLLKLDIKPFSYGLSIQAVYDSGSLYDPFVLTISDDEIMGKFMKAVTQMTAVSLGCGFPTLLSVPHLLSSAFKKMLAITLETDYTFKEAEEFKEGAAAAAQQVAAAPAAGAADTSAAPAAAAKAPEPEEEDDDDLGGGGLFGGDDDDW